MRPRRRADAIRRVPRQGPLLGRLRGPDRRVVAARQCGYLDHDAARRRRRRLPLRAGFRGPDRAGFRGGSVSGHGGHAIIDGGRYDRPDRPARVRGRACSDLRHSRRDHLRGRHYGSHSAAPGPDSGSVRWHRPGVDGGCRGGRRTGGVGAAAALRRSGAATVSRRPDLAPRAWLVWSLAAVTVALSTDNPVYRGLVALAALNVLLTWLPRGRRVRPLALALLFAAGFAALINVIAGHTGADVMVRLPGDWPLIGG